MVGTHHMLGAVPARDEAGTIAACVESIGRAAHDVHGRVTLVVAADCCTDSTASVARAIDVRVLRRGVMTTLDPASRQFFEDRRRLVA